MRWVGFGLALAVSSPVLAAPMVSAEKPQSVAEALEGAGHEVTLGTDDLGDPVLELGLRGYKARLLFMDCDPSGHDRCRSVQFFAAFDAEGTGLAAADAVAFAARHRYAAVTLNAAGDPTLRWDVETGEGIPRAVLVTAAERFLGTVQAMGAMLYPSPAG
ncbi:YbjN domain-containing protein [Sphingomonas sp.]|uniref:YbjN domain-containing protein n=1 Tax=Sphingomonas sp. TaxID=28214 RepID=UPI00286E443C|nr:YbjN domain-containing protein [Sphingomonas sp.]